MCCLTIYKDESNTVVFTHNRDESTARISSFSLSNIGLDGCSFTAPIDPVSKGTWIGSNGVLTAALLNGSNINHHKKQTYAKSRGLIIPSLFESKSIAAFLTNFSIGDFEPFTLILFDKVEDKLVELIWNEITLEIAYLDINEPCIYSSSTLYNDTVKKNRKALFNDYISKPQSADSIWDLHARKGEDHNHFLNVSFNSEIKTLSIIQISLGEISQMRYSNLNGNSSVIVKLQAK
jgi:uncharacterized protein with NRDE domain